MKRLLTETQIYVLCMAARMGPIGLGPLNGGFGLGGWEDEFGTRPGGVGPSDANALVKRGFLVRSGSVDRITPLGLGAFEDWKKLRGTWRGQQNEFGRLIGLVPGARPNPRRER